MRWLQCLIRKWSCVNHQFQFHTQIAYKPAYTAHDPCCLSPFIIGTHIKFNHTNSAIHFSGHSRGSFTSASDYASAKWRLLLHIMVTWSPRVNKYWVKRAIYGICCGWSQWPITIQHVRARWGSVGSWRACSTGSEKAARVSRSIGNLLNGFKKKYLQILIVDSKPMSCLCVISLRWYRKMAVHKCYTFHLKRKIFFAHPWCLLSVVGLGEYLAHDWRAATSVQRALITWREWGLWFE